MPARDCVYRTSEPIQAHGLGHGLLLSGLASDDRTVYNLQAALPGNRFVLGADTLQIFQTDLYQGRGTTVCTYIPSTLVPTPRFDRPAKEAPYHDHGSQGWQPGASMDGAHHAQAPLRITPMHPESEHISDTLDQRLLITIILQYR